MSRRVASTLKALPLVAKVLGRKLGVHVQVGGDAACTDGTTITLPTLPLPKDGKEEELKRLERLAWGYLDHEAAHVRYTDFGLDRSRGGEAGPLEVSLQNVIEDIRIEGELATEYPGCRQVLAGVGEELIIDGTVASSRIGDSPAAIAGNYIQQRLRADLLGQEAYAPLADETEKAFVATFPKGVQVRMDGLMSTVPALQSTADALDLARRIVSMLEDEANKDPEPEESEGGGNDAGQGTDPGIAALKEALAATEDQVAPDQGQIVAHALNKESKNQQAKQSDCTGASSEMDIEWMTDPNGIDLQEVEAVTAKLRAQFVARLQAHRDRFRFPREVGSRLADRRLVNAMTGDPRIFHVRQPEPAINTAVQLLLDRSGSMNGQRIVIARAAMLALGLALGGIAGVAVGAAAFPEIGVCTRLGDHPRRNAKQYALTAGGGTPLASALLWAGAELLSRDEPRRVLFVLTDGQPDNHESARRAMNALLDHGIEIHGIGIQCDVGGVFHQSIRIDAVADLTKGLFAKVEQVLLAA